MAEAIQSRLARIEGQVRGLAEMVDDGGRCGDAITLVSAIKGALDQVALLLLHDHALECFRDHAAADPERQDQALRRLARIYRRHARS